MTTVPTAGKGTGTTGNSPGGDPTSDFNIARLVRKREELAKDRAVAEGELARVREEEANIRRKKDELAKQSEQQDRYEREKKSLLAELDRASVILRKGRAEAAARVELLETTAIRFCEMAEELRGIDEGSWAEEDFADELVTALSTVDIARREYDEAHAKLPILSLDRTGGWSRADGQASRQWPGFVYWVKVGTALAIPATVIAVALYFLDAFRNGFL